MRKILVLLFAVSLNAQTRENGTLDSYFYKAAESKPKEKRKDRRAKEKVEPAVLDQKYFYLTFFTGPNFLQNTSIDDTKTSYQTGYIVDGTLGFCWRYGLHFEFEYAFRRNAISQINFVGLGSSNSGRTQTSSYMGNLLWGFPEGATFWKIEPYIGGGIGYDFQQTHSSNSLVVFNQKWYNFSWQIMTGFAYPIFRNTEIALEYKFHQGVSDFNNHSLGVSFMYKFGYLK